MTGECDRQGWWWYRAATDVLLARKRERSVASRIASASAEVMIRAKQHASLIETPLEAGPKTARQQTTKYQHTNTRPTWPPTSSTPSTASPSRSPPASVSPRPRSTMSKAATAPSSSNISTTTGSKDLQMVSLTLRVLHRPEVSKLSTIYQVCRTAT
jgi:hypothetical protein